MDNYELKPCPFCGGEVELMNSIDLPLEWTVSCKKCRCKTRYYYSPEKAVEDWNLRNDPPNPPLTLEELRELEGEPVWCEDYKLWGIVKVESKGPWANMPFLCGVYHSYGVATNFEYDIEKRGLTLYRRRAEQKEEVQNEP